MMAGKKTNRGGRLRLIIMRRMVQLLFLAVFIFLFLQTDYNGSDHLHTAVNIFFRLDPFLALSVTLAAKTIIALFLPALVVVVLTFFFGRVFCGWFCPMGTLLDICGRILPVAGREKSTYFPHLPLLILIFALVSATFGFALAGYVDPFSILVRGLAQAVYPVLNHLTVVFFTFTYQQLPIVNPVTEPVYSFLRSFILPSSQKFFQLAYLSLFMLLGVLLLEALQRRFFCRNICPLGALLGLIGRLGTFAGRGGNDDCRACRICSSNCRMGAIDEQRKIDMTRCTLCYECVARCPRQIIDFGFSPFAHEKSSMSLSRRKFISAAVIGMLLPAVKGVRVQAKSPDPLLIRPPGALVEQEFLQRCVRCAECIQVCIGNALQPAFLQAGLDGMFSPVLMARSGYCEYNCTLCGQVCPTGAIRQLRRTEKHQWKIGHAWFDKNICLPYAKATPCMVCEEHCPIPEKAIRFTEVTILDSAGQPVTVRQPYVVDELCIGCGICETKCPLPGRSAIYVTSAGEHRDPDNPLLQYGGQSGGYN